MATKKTKKPTKKTKKEPEITIDLLCAAIIRLLPLDHGVVIQGEEQKYLVWKQNKGTDILISSMVLSTADGELYNEPDGQVVAVFLEE